MIQQLLLDPRYKGILIKKYVKKLNQKGEEVYGELQNGLWWKDAQQQLPDGMVIPIILYSDETKPRMVGHAKFYPVFFFFFFFC